MAVSGQLEQTIRQINTAPEDPLVHFTAHMINMCAGNILYVRLVLDLIEQDKLRMKTGNYSLLPVNVAEALLLMFNLKFTSARSFDRVASIFNILLAALRPLDTITIRNVLNAAYVTTKQLTMEDVRDRLVIVIIHYHHILSDWISYDRFLHNYPMDDMYRCIVQFVIIYFGSMAKANLH
jgi:hypothetical protein